MPDINHFTGLPVPLEGEAASGPEAFSSFRDALAGHTVLFATTSSNRDALYTDAPAGSLCASTSAKTVWLKTALPNTWVTVYSDTGWLPIPAANWSASFSDIGSAYRVRADRVSIDLRVSYSGDPLGGGGGDGNIANTPILTLPSSILPGGSGAPHIPFTLEYGGGYYGFGSVFKSSGNLSLAALNPLGALNSGGAVFAYIEYFVS